MSGNLRNFVALQWLGIGVTIVACAPSGELGGAVGVRDQLALEPCARGCSLAHECVGLSDGAQGMRLANTDGLLVFEAVL